jgi:hypothetical protein
MKSSRTFKKYIPHILGVLIVCAAVFATQAVSAQPITIDRYEPLAPIEANGITLRTELADFIIDVFRLAIAVSAALAVVMIIVGGIQYMSTDSWSGKKDGQRRINNALIGLLLVMVSYLILYTINPAIVDIASLRDNLAGGTGVPPTGTPPPPAGPRVVPRDTNTGLDDIREYNVRDTDGKNYIVKAAKIDTANNIDLADLYSFEVIQNPLPVSFVTDTGCQTELRSRAASTIAVACQPLQNGAKRYQIQSDIAAGMEKNYISVDQCENGARQLNKDPICVETKLSYAFYVKADSFEYFNMTKNACEYMRDKAANPSEVTGSTGGIVTDCTKTSPK